MVMEKIKRIRELFAEISIINDKKWETVKEQNYEDAGNLRDEEKRLINEVDDLVGSKGYYKELIRMEKIDFHLENLETSIKELKSLSFEMGKNFNVEIDTQSLLTLKNKRIKIQEELLNFKENVGLSENKS
jgi:hypothetical protein